jgi:hypothetical protein
MHAYAKDERWTHKVPNPLTGQPMTATTEQAHMQVTFAEMKKYNIVKAVVSNDYQAVLRWKAAFPGTLPSYGFNDPSSLDLAFLGREHAAGRLMALGEIGAQYVHCAQVLTKVCCLLEVGLNGDAESGLTVNRFRPLESSYPPGKTRPPEQVGLI